MNTYLILILVILISSYLIQITVDMANLGYFKSDLPAEFQDVYDAEKYAKSQNYLRDNTYFGIIQSSITTPIIILFLISGGFNIVDTIANGAGCGPIMTGLIFTGLLIFGSEIIRQPFSLYDTFVIEQKYGFNKTTLKTYLLDLLKSWGLLMILGGIMLAGVFWFFEKTGELAWLNAWLAMTVLQVILMVAAPVLIMPLFNKFTPLDDGELKKAIEDYANSQDLKIKGVYTMDGSRRSTKSNAYFTGFGKFRRIVLFDTLIANHSVEELVAVLAHEMGHFKKKHIHKLMAISIVSTGFMLFVLSLFIENKGLFAAFKMERLSVYASIVFFGFLYSPISMIVSILVNYLSRKFEYEADAYAAKTFGKPEAMIQALKKLSVDNLSNLTPHPLKVFLEYSHPPVIKRIEAIRR